MMAANGLARRGNGNPGFGGGPCVFIRNVSHCGPDERDRNPPGQSVVSTESENTCVLPSSNRPARPT